MWYFTEPPFIKTVTKTESFDEEKNAAIDGEVEKEQPLRDSATPLDNNVPDEENSIQEVYSSDTSSSSSEDEFDTSTDGDTFSANCNGVFSEVDPPVDTNLPSINQASSDNDERKRNSQKDEEAHLTDQSSSGKIIIST